MSYQYDRRTAATAEPMNMPRMERIVASIESEAKQLAHAFSKYKEDPGKYKPQLDNVEHSANLIASSIRVLLRTLGKSEE